MTSIILVLFFNLAIGSSNKTLNLDQFVNCLSVIYLEKDKDIKCGQQGLYFAKDYAEYAYKKVFGVEMVLPKVKATINGKIYFVNEEERFNDGVICHYELKEIVVEKNLKFIIRRLYSKQITEFKLEFLSQDGNWIFERSEIIKIEQWKAIPMQIETK